MTDSQLTELNKTLEDGLSAIAGEVSEIHYKKIMICYDDETYNMIAFHLNDIATQIKRIADKMEAGQ